MIYSVALLGAGACEVLGVVFLNQTSKSKGVKKALNFALLVATFGCSLGLLSFAMNALPMSVAYAVWHRRCHLLLSYPFFSSTSTFHPNLSHFLCNDYDSLHVSHSVVSDSLRPHGL